MTPDRLDQIDSWIQQQAGYEFGDGPKIIDLSVDLVNELIEALRESRTERDKYKEHSIQLNSILWSIAAALNEIPKGVEIFTYEGGPEDLVGRLLADRDRLLEELK